MNRRSVFVALGAVIAAPATALALRSPEEPKRAKLQWTAPVVETADQDDTLFYWDGSEWHDKNYVSLEGDTPWPLSPFPPK